MKHLEQEQMVAHYYGESSKDVARHLADCYECRSEFADIQRTLAAVKPVEVPARGPQYGAEVWDRVRAHLPEPAPPVWWRMPRRWAAVAATAALMAIAFLAGRHTAPPPNFAKNPPATVVRERVLMVALDSHLERSQVVLLDVAHAADAADVNLVRDEAEDLVGSNRLYRQSALKLGDRKTADVLDQLERVLLEIAHSGPDESKAQIDELRRQIEAQGLLFKVRVIHSNVQNEILPAPAKKAAPANTRPIA
ncbi:MAG: hypothetical protein ACRD3E_14130 [Terriglobales bacterium]